MKSIALANHGVGPNLRSAGSDWTRLSTQLTGETDSKLVNESNYIEDLETDGAGSR